MRGDSFESRRKKEREKQRERERKKEKLEYAAHVYFAIIG